MSVNLNPSGPSFLSNIDRNRNQEITLQEMQDLDVDGSGDLSDEELGFDESTATGQDKANKISIQFNYSQSLQDGRNPTDVVFDISNRADGQEYLEFSDEIKAEIRQERNRSSSPPPFGNRMRIRNISRPPMMPPNINKPTRSQPKAQASKAPEPRASQVSTKDSAAPENKMKSAGFAPTSISFDRD